GTATLVLLTVDAPRSLCPRAERTLDLLAFDCLMVVCAIGAGYVDLFFQSFPRPPRVPDQFLIDRALLGVSALVAGMVLGVYDLWLRVRQPASPPPGEAPGAPNAPEALAPPLRGASDPPGVLLGRAAGPPLPDLPTLPWEHLPLWARDTAARERLQVLLGRSRPLRFAVRPFVLML